MKIKSGSGSIFLINPNIFSSHHAISNSITHTATISTLLFLTIYNLFSHQIYINIISLNNIDSSKKKKLDNPPISTLSPFLNSQIPSGPTTPHPKQLPHIPSLRTSQGYDNRYELWNRPRPRFLIATNCRVGG